MFSAAAEAEMVNVHNHLRTLKGIGNMKENLEAAVVGKTFEFKSMCPEMIQPTQTEDNKVAGRSFQYVNDGEKGHAELYQKLLDNLEGDQEEYPYNVCPVFGFTTEKECSRQFHLLQCKSNNV